MVTGSVVLVGLAANWIIFPLATFAGAVSFRLASP